MTRNRVDWWDRTAYAAIGAALLYGVVLRYIWPASGRFWPFVALVCIAYCLVWSTRALVVMRREERAANERRARFDALLARSIEVATRTRCCPSCGALVTMEPYDIGSGPEMSCPSCEWCWGADGQPLEPMDTARIEREWLAGQDDHG